MYMLLLCECVWFTNVGFLLLMYTVNTQYIHELLDCRFYFNAMHSTASRSCGLDRLSPLHSK